MKNKNIKKIVSNYCKAHGLIPIVISENGSRAWGFANEQSDYDVRVVFKHKDKNIYKSMFDYKNVYTYKHDEKIDVVFWDIKKYLALLYKCNAQTYEIMCSPVVYYKHRKYYNKLSALTIDVCATDLKRLAFHYYGLAHDTLKDGKEDPSKKFLYVIKCLTYIDYILKYEMLPDLDLFMAYTSNSWDYPPDINDLVYKMIVYRQLDYQMDFLTDQSVARLEQFTTERMSNQLEILNNWQLDKTEEELSSLKKDLDKIYKYIIY